ncbi:MAG TPA: TrbI/VirB10 family protein [Terriglobales bacterium]|jgi:hypothetical protein|nr:TrbI/VirB10 family protein [Terriglobales bacterium]
MQREPQQISHENTAQTPDEENLRQVIENAEEKGTPSSFQRFRTLLDQVRRTQQPLATRRELSRDKSKSLFLLLGVSIALLLIFFGVLSSPKAHAPLPGETTHGAPSLGRKVTPGQEQNDAAKALTPMLSADVRDADNVSGSQVTPQDVGGTSPHYNQFRGSSAANPTLLEKPAPGKARSQEQYALKNVDFSVDAASQTRPIPTPPPQAPEGPDSNLKRPSIIFVRAAQSVNPTVEGLPGQENAAQEILPAGTRLVARLEAPVSSAVSAPVIAVVEYNYERNGEVVIPAGAKVFGKLSNVTSAGVVALQFDRIEFPDGSMEKIDATAMDLKFGPLKGGVSGRARGRNFLVRSVTGIGTVAAYVVGGQGTTGFNGPISENSLMRERVAENIGTAGQEELNSLAVNQAIVVTVPGNTRFYIVVEKGNSEPQLVKPAIRSVDGRNATLSADTVPSLEELRELMQLKNELNQMYLQTNTQSPAGQP